MCQGCIGVSRIQHWYWHVDIDDNVRKWKWLNVTTCVGDGHQIRFWYEVWVLHIVQL
jgi:hypothetical protein